MTLGCLFAIWHNSSKCRSNWVLSRYLVLCVFGSYRSTEVVLCGASNIGFKKSLQHLSIPSSKWNKHLQGQNKRQYEERIYSEQTNGHLLPSNIINLLRQTLVSNTGQNVNIYVNKGKFIKESQHMGKKINCQITGVTAHFFHKNKKIKKSCKGRESRL